MPFGPAAAYGAALPMAANASGSNPGEAYDAVTPSLLESSAIGFMTASHKGGLQSGGLVGYSTFFTGYRPEDHGVGRAMSLGRLGAQGVSLSARAMMHTPLANTAASQYIAPFTQAHRFGIGGALDAAVRGPAHSAGVPDPFMADAANTFSSSSPSGRNPRARSQTRGLLTGRTPRGRNLATVRAVGRGEGVTPNLGSGTSLSSSRVRNVHSTQTTGRLVRNAPSGVANPQINPKFGNAIEGRVDGVVSNAGGEAVEEVAEETAEAADGPASKFFKAITGILGGEGYDKTGQNFKGRTVKRDIAGDTFEFLAGSPNSQGANIASGAAGKYVGMAFKGVAIYEAARLAGQGMAYAAGEGYEAMVETTTRLRRRVGQDDSMSGGYFNRAASTERQRAMQSLNENRLDPKTQLMGNEAYMGHTV